jgi:uncharacterized protein YciI
MYFAIIATDAVTCTYEKRLAAKPAHRERMQALHATGRLLLAGPLLQDHAIAETTCGSLIVADFESAEAALAWINADPFVTEGIYGEVVIKPFVQAFPPVPS